MSDFKCKTCDFNEGNYSIIKKDKWLGTRPDIPKKFLYSREFSLGTDWYPKTDLLEISCKRCSYKTWEKIFK